MQGHNLEDQVLYFNHKECQKGVKLFPSTDRDPRFKISTLKHKQSQRKTILILQDNRPSHVLFYTILIGQPIILSCYFSFNIQF